MKAVWLREVQAILDSEEFSQWWQTLTGLEREQAQVRERHEELLAQSTLTAFRAELTQKKAIDTLYEAGELEDSAALLLAESAEIENKAYEAVANFESQRIAVSDLYSQMGAVEHKLLSAQAEVEQLKQQHQDSKDTEGRKELARQLRRKQEIQADLDRRFRDSATEYERGNARKMRLWEEVEQMWSRSLDINLSVAERRAKSRRARRLAEQLFKEAEQHKQAAEGLEQQAEEASRKMEELEQATGQQRVAAKRMFGCIVGTEFLYWPRRENNKEVYCLAINAHPSGYNIELEAKGLYLVGRQRGVEFIEPIPPEGGVCEEEDRRIDRFFLGDDDCQPEPEGS